MKSFPAQISTKLVKKMQILHCLSSFFRSYKSVYEKLEHEVFRRLAYL